MATYDGDADHIFESALNFSEMAAAMTGMARYVGLPEDGTAQEGDRMTFEVTFWGFLKMPPHNVYIETLDRAKRVVQSREYGEGIDQWDHNLSVQPADGVAMWTDTVVIDADWKTGIVAHFAAYMYTRRHKFRKAQTITRLILRD